MVAQCLLKPHTVAEGPHVKEHTDSITDVLRECEATLRALAQQGRLTDAALSAFIRLAHTALNRRWNAAGVASVAVRCVQTLTVAQGVHKTPRSFSISVPSRLAENVERLRSK